MIHTLLKLTRPLIVLDTETTGTDVKSDRIVELGFEIWTAKGRQSEWRSLINPGMHIPTEATGVHKITDAMMHGCRLCGYLPIEHPVDELMTTGTKSCPEFKHIPIFAELAPRLAKGFSNCDFGGKNVLRFDLQILAYEFERARIPWTYAGARVLDAERLEALAEPRSLSHLYKKYTGSEHDGAHSALSDARASSRVIAEQLAFYAGLPRDLDTLHAKQWPGMIDSSGKFRFINGEPCFSNWGKYANKPMKVADKGYWDFILSNNFPPDVKVIAAKAKLGNYPTKVQV